MSNQSPAVLTVIQNNAATGWTEPELHLLDRLAGVLMRRQAHIEYSIGMAEDGAPWAAITATTTGITLFHFARTPNGYGVFGEHIEAKERETLSQLVAPFF